MYRASALPPRHLQAAWALVRAYRRGDVALHDTRNGTTRIQGELPPDDGALLIEVLDEIARSTPGAARDLAEGRSDALVELMRRALASDATAS